MIARGMVSAIPIWEFSQIGIPPSFFRLPDPVRDFRELDQTTQRAAALFTKDRIQINKTHHIRYANSERRQIMKRNEVLRILQEQ